MPMLLNVPDIISSKWWPWCATYIRRRSWKLSIILYSISLEILEIFSQIIALSSSWVQGRCLKISTLRYSHKKKSQGLKSRERGDHATSSHKEIRWPGNMFCRMVIFTFLPVYWTQFLSNYNLIWVKFKVTIQNLPYRSIWYLKSRGMFSSRTRWRLFYRCSDCGDKIFDPLKNRFPIRNTFIWR